MISADEFKQLVVKVKAPKRLAGPSADKTEAKKKARLNALQIRIAKAQRRVDWAERVYEQAESRLRDAKAFLDAIQKAHDEAAQ